MIGFRGAEGGYVGLRMLKKYDRVWDAAEDDCVCAC